MTRFPDAAEMRRTAERAMTLPVGLSTPLWIAFGAAASAGVAWWWMTRGWRPTHLEGQPLARSAAKIDAPVDAGAEVVHAEAAFANPDAAGYPRIAEPPLVPPEARTAQHEAQIPAESSATPDKAGYPIVAPGPEAQDAADDLTQLAGVGPKIAAALAERGVTRFAQLAQWTTQDVAAFDEALNLRGRALRSDWPGQARKLVQA